jgi:Uma2 family endonuclease
MSQAATQRATYDDILRAPPDRVAEILAGELVLTPRPTPRHARVGYRLGGGLQGFDSDTGDPGGWWILPEPELHLAGHVLVPDLAGWRLPCDEVFGEEPFVAVVPDWVMEVLSPATAHRDRIQKADIYAGLGIGWMWLADPDMETLEVFELRDGVWARVQAFEGASRIRARPFDAVELDLGHVWPPPRKPKAP